MSDLKTYLKALVDAGGSDLHLKAGHPPVLRIQGDLKVARFPKLAPKDTERIAKAMVPVGLQTFLETTGGADFAHDAPGLGRFRTNVFRQRGLFGVVMRRVLPAPPVLDSLHLPEAVKRLASEPRGLALVTGPTGSGKTTTCAAMINHINSSRACTVVTLEDPIEILHTDKKALINQREIGTDTESFHAGLRHVLRQDPDVIFVGEMRDPETVWAALASAETGHFVISTLHTIDAQETVNRIVEFFPSERQRQIRHSLAGALKGVVSQRLVVRKDGKGRLPAVEILITTGRVHEAIIDPDETRMIPEIIAEGDFYGMQTFDQHLLELFESDAITLEDALHTATSPHDLRLAMRKAGVA
ncbi:MAG: type IV pilus twitching motility protein PilT [Actinomycetota bacterium]